MYHGLVRHLKPSQRDPHTIHLVYKKTRVPHSCLYFALLVLSARLYPSDSAGALNLIYKISLLVKASFLSKHGLQLASLETISLLIQRYSPCCWPRIMGGPPHTSATSFPRNPDRCCQSANIVLRRPTNEHNLPTLFWCQNSVLLRYRSTRKPIHRFHWPNICTHV